MSDSTERDTPPTTAPSERLRPRPAKAEISAPDAEEAAAPYHLEADPDDVMDAYERGLASFDRLAEAIEREHRELEAHLRPLEATAQPRALVRPYRAALAGLAKLQAELTPLRSKAKQRRDTFAHQWFEDP